MLQHVPVILAMVCFYVFCLSFNLKSQVNYDLYTDEIIKSAPNIPSKSDDISIDDPDYIRKMNG